VVSSIGGVIEARRDWWWPRPCRPWPGGSHGARGQGLEVDAGPLPDRDGPWDVRGMAL